MSDPTTIPTTTTDATTTTPTGPVGDTDEIMGIVTSIYNQIRLNYDKELTASNLLELVTMTIKLIQDSPKIKNVIQDPTEKKQIAIDVLIMLINESDLTQANKSYMLNLVDMIVPKMIDTIIDIAKNRIDIGKNVNAATGNKCLCF
jgi:hypothetical protein